MVFPAVGGVAPGGIGVVDEGEDVPAGLFLLRQFEGEGADFFECGVHGKFLLMLVTITAFTRLGRKIFFLFFWKKKDRRRGADGQGEHLTANYLTAYLF
jgi:hypothetical protein